MDDILDEASDPAPRILTGIGRRGKVQPPSDGLAPDVSIEPIPTSAAFLVAHWLVGQGEG
jgi:hypothetical protein